MRTAYKVLAYVIAAEVAVQAAVVVWAVAGLGTWIMNGGVADASLMESDQTPFPEVAGFMVHGINGMAVLPLVALALLVLSFFTRQRRAILAAVAVFGLVLLQIALGLLGHAAPFFGALHGLNALLLFSAALYAARGIRVPGDSDRRSAATAAQQPSSAGTS